MDDKLNKLFILVTFEVSEPKSIIMKGVILLVFLAYCVLGSPPNIIGPKPKPRFIRNPEINLFNPGNGKIIGGNDIEVGEFPFQISMQINPYFGEKYHTCGGIILDETHVK